MGCVVPFLCHTSAFDMQEAAWKTAGTSCELQIFCDHKEENMPRKPWAGLNRCNPLTAACRSSLPERSTESALCLGYHHVSRHKSHLPLNCTFIGFMLTLALGPLCLAHSSACKSHSEACNCHLFILRIALMQLHVQLFQM